jgi:3-phytase
MRSAVPVLACSLLLAACYVGPAPDDGDDDPPPPPVDPPRAPFETQPLFDDDPGGLANADDPAIWIHPTDPMASVIVVTKKTAGLSVFDVTGKELVAIPAPPAPTAADKPGRFNNVDLVYGVKLAGATVDVAITTDRGRDRLRFYAIDPRGAAAGSAVLRDVTSPDAVPVFSADQAEINAARTVYGLATWKAPDGAVYAIASQAKTTRLARLRIVEVGGTLGYELAGTKDLPAQFTLPSGAAWAPCNEPGELAQSEGMVIDRGTGMLYVGQEQVGIWRVRADLGAGEPTLLEKTKEFGVPATFDEVTEECVVSGPDPGVGGRLAADVEGLSIYYRAGTDGYVLVSAQGENKFAVYQRTGNQFIGLFDVPGAGGLDGVEECDGLDVVSAPVGEFKRGLVVMQDGHNEPAVTDATGMPRTNTNFKFVPWDTIAKQLDLAIEPAGWTPR